MAVLATRCHRCGSGGVMLRRCWDGYSLCQPCVTDLVAKALAPRWPKPLSIAELIDKVDRYTRGDVS